MVNEEEIYFGSPTVLLTVIVPNFNGSIVLANKIRVKPYREGYKTPRVPQKYLTPEYGYKGGKLVHLASGDIVPSNGNKAGTPRITMVNGQDLYNGRIKEFARATFMTKLKEYLFPYFEEQGIIREKGLTCQLHFYLLDKGKFNIDNDNLWIWTKTVCDLLKQYILTDDDPKTICAHNTKTFFVTDEYKTRLEISLIK